MTTILFSLFQVDLKVLTSKISRLETLLDDEVQQRVNKDRVSYYSYICSFILHLNSGSFGREIGNAGTKSRTTGRAANCSAR